MSIIQIAMVQTDMFCLKWICSLMTLLPACLLFLLVQHRTARILMIYSILQTENLLGRWSAFSSAVKEKAAVTKEKVTSYIKNELPQEER